MNRSEEHLWALAARAHKRYPDVPLDLAMLFAASDNRKAGLGALGKRGPAPDRVIGRWKEQDPMDGRVTYFLRIRQHAGYRYKRETVQLYDFCHPGVEASIVQLDFVPERNDVLRVRYDRHDFETRSGRRMIAAALLQARRDLRL